MASTSSSEASSPANSAEASALISDKAETLRLVADGKLQLSKVSVALRGDKDVVAAAIYEDPSSISFASEELKHDWDFLMRHLSLFFMRHSPVLKWVLADRRFWIFYLAMHPYELREAVEFCEEIRCDKDVLRFCVSKNPSLFVHASIDLKKDVDYLRTLSTCYYGWLEHCSEEVRNDRQFLTSLVLKNSFFFQYSSAELRDNLTLARLVVKKDPCLFAYVGSNLKANRYFVLDVLARDAHQLCHASDDFKNDRMVVKAAVARTPSAIQYASEELRADKDMMNFAISFDPSTLQYASEKIRKTAKITLV